METEEGATITAKKALGFNRLHRRTLGALMEVTPTESLSESYIDTKPKTAHPVLAGHHLQN